MLYQMREFMALLFACVALAGYAQSDGISFGALDIIRGSGASTASGTPKQEGSVSLGALDALISFGADETDATPVSDAALGALEAVATGSVGEYRPGALSFITRQYSSGNYYSAGAWQQTERPSMGGAANTGLSVWGDRYYVAPQWGRITSRFGYRPSFGRMHKGIDIAMRVGDTVCAPLPGIVDRISYEAGGYGNYVVVKHDDGLETRYAHLSAVLVAPGDRVGAYQPVALSGNTGNSTGPHLHFETRIFGTAVDPQSIFDFSGGFMSPRAGGMYQQDFRTAATGALDRVSRQGSHGKSLDGRRTYVVRAGDTLKNIAARAGTSVRRLCQLNFFSEDEQLQPGTMIRISK